MIDEGTIYSLHASMLFNLDISFDELFKDVITDVKRQLPYDYYENKYLIPQRPSPYANDNYPVIISKDTLFFSRTGFDKIPAIYKFNPLKKEVKKIISIPGSYYTANNRYLAWIEYKEHPRWNKKVNTKIRIYDLQNEKKFWLPAQGKYQSPMLSKTNNKLIVVNYDKLIVPHLEIWDVDNKKKIMDDVFPQFESLRNPAFEKDSIHVVFSALPHNASNAIYRYNLITKQIQKLKDEPENNVFFPKIHRNYLVYQKDDYGYIRTYITDLQNNGYSLLYMIPSKYGVFSYDTKADSLCFSEMTKTGMQIRCKKIYNWKKEPQQGDSIQIPNKHYVPMPILVDDLNIQRDSVQVPLLRGNSLAGKYKISKYNRFKSYFKPYKWDYGIHKDYQDEYSLGASVSMIDILDENYFSAGVEYNVQDEYSTYVQWEYKRFFPIIGYKFSRDTHLGIKSPYLNHKLYMRIPLNFNSGVWKSFVHVSTQAFYSTNPSGFYTPFTTDGYFSFKRIKAYRNVDYRWKFVIQGEYGKEPKSSSNLYRGMLKVNFPGIAKNDVFTLKFFGEENNGPYSFGYWLNPVRSAPPVNYHSLRSIRFSYHAPLAYPDWGLRSVFNIKRLRYKIFYDNAWYDAQSMQSAGVQLLGDWNFLGLKETSELGVQFAYLKPFNTWSFSVVFQGVTF